MCIYIYYTAHILPKPQPAPTEMTTHTHSNSCLARRPVAEFEILMDFGCPCLPVESGGWPNLFVPVSALKLVSQYGGAKFDMGGRTSRITWDHQDPSGITRNHKSKA